MNNLSLLILLKYSVVYVSSIQCDKLDAKDVKCRLRICHNRKERNVICPVEWQIIYGRHLLATDSVILPMLGYFYLCPIYIYQTCGLFWLCELAPSQTEVPDSWRHMQMVDNRKQLPLLVRSLFSSGCFSYICISRLSLSSNVSPLNVFAFLDNLHEDFLLLRVLLMLLIRTSWKHAFTNIPFIMLFCIILWHLHIMRCFLLFLLSVFLSLWPIFFSSLMKKKLW